MTSKGSISEAIIEHLKDNDKPIGYFHFCSAESSQNSYRSFLAIIALQLITHLSSSSPPLRLGEMYRTNRMGERNPTMAQLEQTIHILCDSFNRSYIIIDALDECPYPDQLQLALDLLRELVTRPNHDVWVLASSRPEPAIQVVLHGIVEHTVRLDPESYRQALNRIADDIREKVLQVLAWVMLSKRTLTLLEIMTIFSIDYDSTRALLPNKESIHQEPKTFLAPFEGLLCAYPIKYPYAEGASSRMGVRLAHFTMLEYLQEEGHNYPFKDYSLKGNEARRFIADCSRALIRKWISSRSDSEQASPLMGRDVGQLVAIFDLTWSKVRSMPPFAGALLILPFSELFGFKNAICIPLHTLN
jgi:hypothetical protein